MNPEEVFWCGSEGFLCILCREMRFCWVRIEFPAGFRDSQG